MNPNDSHIKHVQFEGADCDTTGTHYGASISFEKAMNPEVLVAYKMNDEDIPADHGFPLRLVAPGIVGARQVKWLTSIRTSKEESTSHWQKKDYRYSFLFRVILPMFRAFSPSVEAGADINYDSVPAIQEYPVQSAICQPASGTKISKGTPISSLLFYLFSLEDGTINVSGYAWSGGGRGIIRVEISTDNGKTWYSAQLKQDPEQDLVRNKQTSTVLIINLLIRIICGLGRFGMQMFRSQKTPSQVSSWSCYVKRPTELITPSQKLQLDCGTYADSSTMLFIASTSK